MAAERLSDFDLAAVYEALDAQRQARGLTWRQTMQEINGSFGRTPNRPISTSTVTNMRTKTVAEGDGVLQMLRWLDRSPESFIPGHRETSEERLPPARPNQVLRFDTRKLHAALDARRVERRMTWKEVAREIGGIGASSLTHLSRGGRTGFPYVARLVAWLGRPVADFTRVADL